MLYPQLNESRFLIDLGGVWQFQTAGAENYPESWTSQLMDEPLTMAVPASYNDQKDNINLRNHYGWVMYQRTFTVPRAMQNERVVLRFGAVTHLAEVYLNGKKLGRHKGGFLPFEFEINTLLQDGRNLLCVAVDNRISYHTLPVGNEDGTAFFDSDNPGVPSVEWAKKHRKPQNHPNFDFFNYAGIIRPVRLYTTPKAYIRDVALVPGLRGTTGLVAYQIETVGEADAAIEILDEDGQCVAAGTGKSGILEIENAHLWNPGAAYLYTARITFGEDLYEQPFGVRTVEVKGTQFLINGRPFYFKGFGKHEDSFFRGRGMDECLNVKDISLMKWMGANSFRTSHYPYAEEMYNLCDREGIVVIDETPAVGIGAGPEKDPYKVMDIAGHHREVIEAMIARDKNHPCVVMWSLANEPDTEHFPQSAHDYFQKLYALAHELDPQNRPVTMITCQNDYTKDITTRTMDVCCFNRYYGWYNLCGDLEAAGAAFDMEMDFWQALGKPVMITEYGADAYPGLHNVNGEMFSEEFQVEYYKCINAQIDKRPFFVGEHVWNFADFSTTQGILRVGGSKKGILTRDRCPKLAAHYLRERWRNIPDLK